MDGLPLKGFLMLILRGEVGMRMLREEKERGGTGGGMDERMGASKPGGVLGEEDVG